MKIDSMYSERLTRRNDRRDFVPKVRSATNSSTSLRARTRQKSLPNHALIDGTDTDYMKLLTDREDGVARIIDLIKETQALIANINARRQGGASSFATRPKLLAK